MLFSLTLVVQTAVWASELSSFLVMTIRMDQKYFDLSPLNQQQKPLLHDTPSRSKAPSTNTCSSILYPHAKLCTAAAVSCYLQAF